MIYFQVQYFLATLTGRVILPSTQETTAILHAIDEDRRRQGLTDKGYHSMLGIQKAYLQDLITEARLPPQPDYIYRLLPILILRLVFSFPILKTYKYNVKTDGTIVETREGRVVNTRWDLARLVTVQLARLLRRDFKRVLVFVCSLLRKKISTLLLLS